MSNISQFPLIGSGANLLLSKTEASKTATVEAAPQEPLEHFQSTASGNVQGDWGGMTRFFSASGLTSSATPAATRGAIRDAAVADKGFTGQEVTSKEPLQASTEHQLCPAEPQGLEGFLQAQRAAYAKSGTILMLEHPSGFTYPRTAPGFDSYLKGVEKGYSSLRGSEVPVTLRMSPGMDTLVVGTGANGEAITLEDYFKANTTYQTPAY